MIEYASQAECNRVDNMHPDTLAQTFYLRSETKCYGAKVKGLC